ncbi:MAG: carboxymuconolactone decarboxylase family protein [Pseudomonadales bacterium]
MRLDKSRIEPLAPDKVRALQLELFGECQTEDENVLNVTGLWAKHPKLMVAQRNLQKHIFRDLTISPRLRELAIIRIGWRCNSGYELAQHAVFGKEAGLDSSDLARIIQGSDSTEWSRLESAVIRSVDEMFECAFVSEETWAILSDELNEQQLLDLLSIVGRYWSVSVILNSTGLQLEEETVSFEAHLPKSL